MDDWLVRLSVVLGAAVWGACVGAYAARRYARPRCHHVFSGPRQLVRQAWVRHCEACGHAELSSNPIPQPIWAGGANINPDPTYPRPPASPAPPPRKP